MATKLRSNVQRRIAVFISFMLMFIIVLGGRLAWMQLVQGDELQKRVDHQVGESKILQSPRGTIYDRQGRELAVSIMTKSLYVDPHEVKDADQLAQDLSPLIGMPVEDIKERIAVGGGFVWLKRKLEPDVVTKVKQLIYDKKLNCLNFEDESKRYYPNDVLAAQVLGFVGTDDTGLDGIELIQNDVIKGKTTKRYVMTDKNSKPIFNSVLSNNSFEKCKNVYLTLDSTIQFIVEQNLDKAMIETKPRAITAIVMNPKTGEILAMANRPTFNPNEFGKYSPTEWKNRAVSFVYEPGSTFKAIVAAAALQEGTVTPNQIFHVPSYVMVSGRRIQNWSDEDYGNVTFTKIIKESINTGFVQVGMQLGANKLNEYVHLFGFGKITDVGLPGEEVGILFNPNDMRDSDLATMSIGQSIAVTPIQLVTAMSAIANKGVLLKPTILKEIRNADNTIFSEEKTTEIRRAIPEETALELSGMLEQVVASGGASKAAVKGYRIAGKTGTAEKLRDDGSGYLAGHYIASFCGFAPVEDPQITILVIIDDPNGTYYGGQIAAPIAGQIFEQVLRYLNVKPSTNNLNLKEFTEKEKIVEVEPASAVVVPQGKVLIPDMSGKSLRQAAEDLKAIGISMIPEGTGTAFKQDIAPNAIVDPGATMTVYFRSD
ncbi:MAG: ftsI [Massilibacillus sp.]|nr:ftsI [Massilibacillus sp.]